MDSLTGILVPLITVRGMLRVMERKGWRPSSGEFGATGVYTLSFNHRTACGVNRRNGAVETPSIPLMVDNLWETRVKNWAEAVADRHGISVETVLTEAASWS